MGRPQSGCGRCGGQSRRRSAQNIVGVCAYCTEQICDRHWRWNSEAGEYMCSACDRKRG